MSFISHRVQLSLSKAQLELEVNLVSWIRHSDFFSISYHIFKLSFEILAGLLLQIWWCGVVE